MSESDDFRLMEEYLIKKYKSIEITGKLEKGRYCIIDSRVHGLFACFYCLLYGLYICELEDLKPVIILGRNHLYSDENKKDNIFGYFYRKSHKIKEEYLENTGKITVQDPGIYLQWCRISSSEKTISNLLIQKYFILKTPVFRIIEDYYLRKMNGLRMLGVHFRGTDKIKETALVAFEAYEQKIDLMFRMGACDKFFLATDELDLKERIAGKYRGKVIVYNLRGSYDAAKQGRGLHFSHNTPYLSALDALVECYLLARCQFLLSSSGSSMSLFATFINPDLLHLVTDA